MQLTEVERFHDCCFVHTELKPDNILTGLGSEAGKLFLVDLELVRRYCDPNTLEHVQYGENCSSGGNPIFASNHKLQCEKLSRRDDLASIALMLVYFLRGTLPWSTPRNGKRWLQEIKALKLSCSPKELCDGLPVPILSLMGHANALPFEAKPDYEGMRDLFRRCLHMHGKPPIACSAKLCTEFVGNHTSPKRLQLESLPLCSQIRMEQLGVAASLTPHMYNSILTSVVNRRRFGC